MENQYKLIISNNNIYQEIELVKDLKTVKIGTTGECEVRLHRNDFFDDFILSVELIDEEWNLICSDSVYIQKNALRVLTQKLNHGDEISVFYRNYEQKLMTLYFSYDFEHLRKRYESVIDISKASTFQMGSYKDCQIRFTSSNTQRERISVNVCKNKLVLEVLESEYGILKNGSHSDRIIEIFNTDFFSCAQFGFFYEAGKLYFTKDKDISISSFNVTSLCPSSNVLPYPKFNKSPRIKSVLSTEAIEILDPPEKPKKSKANLLMSILPSVAMLLVIVLMATLSGGSMGTMIVFSGCSMGIGIFTTLFNHFSTRKEFKKNVQTREKNYKHYIEQKELQIREARKEEESILRSLYPESAHFVDRVKNFSGNLFDRSLEDADFLTFRVGTGEAEATRKITFVKKERITVDDELMLLPQELEKKYRMLKSVPIIADLKKSHNIGIVGQKPNIYEMFKIILLDICCRQYFRDISLMVVVGEENKKQFNWMRFLPHLRDDERFIRNIVCDDTSRAQQFEYLYKELSNREALASKNVTFKPIVIMVYDGTGLYSHPLSQYIKTAWKYQTYFIFFGGVREELPAGCGLLISLEDSSSGKMVDSENGLEAVQFAYSSVSDKDMEDVCLKFAPVFCEEVSLEGTLTKNITLFSLLGIWSADDLDLQKRWATSDICKSMSAPLGVRTKGEVVSLDLHEDYHGPHGLVAGTTGSGKSEILQSYILSMATLYHPYEVGFVIIDFKGGGMVNQFKKLPHLIGAITDIDGKEIDRSLLSIHAELEKRKVLFAEAEVNNISAYIRKYKKGEVKEAVPHLILIVDEFAELKADQPDFMKELISAARIGRSLGVHLILATQKPSGVIDGQIWSNSKFKLCLKVQSKEDSNEVLKSPLAAEIREPGRAYLQVGNNEIFELFQSAYSGASIQSEEVGTIHPFKLHTVEASGRRKLLFEQKVPKGKESAPTQLKAIVEKVNSYCASEGIKALPPISLPALTKYVVYDESLMPVAQHQNIVIPLGIYDDPSHQKQDVCYIDLTSFNTFIVGSAQYGKTNLLQLIVHSAATLYSPQEVNFYILDFSSMIMKNMENLKHIGGVVLTSEDEKFKNFMKMMLAEIASRKQLLAGLGLTSYASYKEAGYRELPQIVILLDNFVPLKELYANFEDSFIAICRDGLSLGISVVVANNQTNGVGYKIMSNFAQRVSLYCNDSGEYSNLFERCKNQPSNVPGRGLIQLDKQIYEFQSFLSFDGQREIERVQQMRCLVDILNQKYEGKRAKRIPEVPALLTQDYLAEQYDLHSENGYEVAVGIDYERVAPVIVDLLSQSVIAITGRKKSGKTNFVNLLTGYLSGNMFTSPSQLYLIDDFSHQLKPFEMLGITESYTIDASEIISLIDDIHAELQERFELLCDEGMDALMEKPLLMLMVANREAIQVLSKSAGSMKKYKEVIGKFASLKVCIVYTDIENSAIGFSGPEVLKLLKDNRNLYFFDDLKNLKLYDVNSQAMRLYKKEIERGDCYHITNDETVKLKTAKING